jgi:ParB-like chromosome segregation protein Spo0J
MKITMIKTVDLKPYPNNPRKNDQSIDFVANSIKEFGFKVPIVVDKDRTRRTGLRYDEVRFGHPGSCR